MISRTLDKVRDAYQNRVRGTAKVAYAEGAAKEQYLAGGQYIKSLIYGGLDGIITTFAVVAGVAGASLSPGIVLILGFANLIADGLSMAIGDYLSTRAEKEYAEAQRSREEWEIKNHPEAEKREMVSLYMEKGIEQLDAEQLTSILSRYEPAWVEVMIAERLGILEDDESPLKNALVTFFSFGVFGFIPLLAYVMARFIPFFDAHTLVLASALTAIALFVLGVQKVHFTNKHWFTSGLEMLLVGGVAAVAAYGIGVLLSGLA